MGDALSPIPLRPCRVGRLISAASSGRGLRRYGGGGGENKKKMARFHHAVVAVAYRENGRGG